MNRTVSYSAVVAAFAAGVVACVVMLIVAGPGEASAAEGAEGGESLVRRGLLVHLDAASLPTARPTPPIDGDRLATLPNQADRGGMFAQSVRDAQPKLRVVDSQAWIEFDGQDDHLVIAGPDAPVDAATVFVLARPRTHAGDFRGPFAAGDGAGNDYQTGINLDFGPASIDELSVINIEGAGFSGFADLLDSSLPFDRFHLFAVRVADDGEVTLRLEGERVGARPRGGEPLHLNQMMIGARYLDNSGGAPFAQSFFDGDIAAVLVYDRLLDESEHDQVEAHLLARREQLEAAAESLRSGHRLQVVDDAPPVQVLVPGLEVHELPVDLPNINNVAYRPDGKLFALAYDGNVWLLSDTTGDGLEDTAELFWENDGSIVSPIGMTLTPPDYEHGDGIFFASKHEIALVVDTNGDDRADEKITVADGWQPIMTQVDALGVALDDDGAVYFGLGVENFADAYLVDANTGESRFTLDTERGTIQRVEPDFSSRQTVATGIRFSVALAFNQHGDLFATDQEGATWLPHGNPFDELLHIQPDRHYGFPPRHRDHLPNVIDEPSTFDYGPQHQSTCGLHFNVPVVEGGPVFGPEWWRHDAIVAGESRGNIYRTKLVKTSHGYVAHNEIIARVGQLTIDAAPTPDGGLIVTCHSGDPDWGTGPGGAGTLYKIVYADRAAPQPVMTWAAGPREVRVAFDRPLDSAALRGVADAARIEYGQTVRAGDRFEAMAPPYAVVRQQRAMRRHDLAIHAIKVSQDRRTLIVETDPHPLATHYALTLPGMGRPDAADAAGLPQHPAIDLHYTLGGVAATWADDRGNIQWAGWLPHLDLDVSRQLTRHSAAHERLWEHVEQPGVLTLHTRLDLHDMLRPAVQPGSQRGFEYALEEETSLTFDASTEVHVSASTLATDPELREIEVELTTGPDTRFTVAFHTNEDERQRPLALRRLHLPWSATDAAPADSYADAVPPELEDGDWAAGRELFFSDRAMCSRCHMVGGEGGRIGPDLSNLIHRDYASTVRDIEQPTATLNPDHVGYQIELDDGRVLVGVPRSDGDGELIVGDMAGNETRVQRSAVVAMEPVAISLMPPGLNIALGEEDFRDLMTFLMTRPLEAGPIEEKTPPRARSRAEVDAVLADAQRPEGTLEPMRILLIAGPKDHGPDEHDYPLWQQRWRTLLGLAPEVEVDAVMEWPDTERIERADVLVIYRMGTWNEQQARQIDAHLERGGGAVYIHWAVGAAEHGRAKAERTGLAWGEGATFRHGPLSLSFTDHPITRGFETLDLLDESYWRLVGDPHAIDILSTGEEDGEPQPLMWTHEVGPGRVFVSIPGHYTWTFDDPLFRVLLLRGIAWAGQQPIDRFTDLATIGARIRD